MRDELLNVAGEEEGNVGSKSQEARGLTLLSWHAQISPSMASAHLAYSQSLQV